MSESVLNFFVKLYLVMTCFAIHSVNSSSNFATQSGKESVALNCSIYFENDALVANCANLNWTFVDLRCVPVTTEVLLLDRNNLVILTNGSFQTLTSLRQLSIQSSNVHQMEYASHSVSPANEKRVVLLVQQTQLYNIPGSLYDVLEDSRIIVISDLSAPLDYIQRQAMRIFAISNELDNRNGL